MLTHPIIKICLRSVWTLKPCGLFKPSFHHNVLLLTLLGRFQICESGLFWGVSEKSPNYFWIWFFLQTEHNDSKKYFFVILFLNLRLYICIMSYCCTLFSDFRSNQRHPFKHCPMSYVSSWPLSLSRFIDSLIHWFIDSLSHWVIESLSHWVIISKNFHSFLDLLYQYMKSNQFPLLRFSSLFYVMDWTDHSFIHSFNHSFFNSLIISIQEMLPSVLHLSSLFWNPNKALFLWIWWVNLWDQCTWLLFLSSSCLFKSLKEQHLHLFSNPS